MGLEDQIYGSKVIRNFLKLHSENYQARVVKATLMLGIQYLENVCPDLRMISVRDIEDLVVKQANGLIIEKKLKKRAKEQRDPNMSVQQNTEKRQRKKEKRRKLIQKVKDLMAEEGLDDPSQLQTSAAVDSPLKAATLKTEDSPQRWPKAPSDWREPSRSPSSKRSSPEAHVVERKSRFVVDNPHQNREARSASLNPRIYPEWWGEEDEIQRLASKERTGYHPARKGQKDRADSLDQRLEHARQHKKKSPKKRDTYN